MPDGLRTARHFCIQPFDAFAQKDGDILYALSIDTPQM